LLRRIFSENAVMFQNNLHINILAKLDEFAFAFLLLQDDNI